MATTTATSCTIEVRDPDGNILTFPFECDRAIVGRAADAEVRLDHGMVSRHHAVFERDATDGRVKVKDLGSRNGTLVNARAVSEHYLAHGDRVSVGPFDITLHGPSAPGAATTSTRIVLADTAGRISTLREHQAPRVDAVHLTNLTEFSQALLTETDAAKRMHLLCELMVGQQFHGRWAALVRINLAEPEGPPQLLREAQARYGSVEPYVSRGALRRVRETGEAVLAANVGVAASAAEVNVEMSISPNVAALAAVACPVAHDEKKLDLLYVMLPPAYGSPEWLALASLAVKQYQQAESAWADRRRAEAAAAMEHELERARQIQMRLVPRDPAFEGLDVAIGFEPCKQVGGDYVDAVRMADGRVLLTIADVCGKGLHAALVGSGVHTMVRAGIFGALSLSQLMDNLNRYLCEMLPIESYVTMLAAAVDLKTGVIEIVNAGHPPPLLIAPSGQSTHIEGESNLPLGIDHVVMTTIAHHLQPGEVLAMYTDGLSELRNAAGEELGIDGLCAELHGVIQSLAGPSIRPASPELLRRLDARLGGRQPDDDRTFLLARRV